MRKRARHKKESIFVAAVAARRLGRNPHGGGDFGNNGLGLSYPACAMADHGVHRF